MIEKPTDLTEALRVSSSTNIFSVHLWRKGQQIQFSIDGFAMPGLVPQEHGGGQGDNSDKSKLKDQPTSLQDRLHMHLQELFRGRVIEQQSPKQFSSESERLAEERKNSIEQALKSIPSQMA